jgi:hypothetical protein
MILRSQADSTAERDLEAALKVFKEGMVPLIPKHYDDYNQELDARITSYKTLFLPFLELRRAGKN